MQGRPRRLPSADTAASRLPPHTQLEPGTRLSPHCADPAITEPGQPAQRWPERTVPWAANELGDAREWGLLLFTLPRCWAGREVLSSTLSRSGGSMGFPRYSLWGEHGVRGAGVGWWQRGHLWRRCRGCPLGSGVQGPPRPSPADMGLGHRTLTPSSSLLESRAVPRGGCCGESRERTPGCKSNG